MTDTISSTGPEAPGLFAGAPGEGPRDSAFQKRRTGQVRLRPEDLEFEPDFAGPEAGKGWRLRLVVAILFLLLTLLLGLGAGNPGAAAGLMPLPLDAVSPVLGLAAVGAAVGAFVFFMSAVRRGAAANAPRSSRLARRPVFVGTGAYGVQIGEEGLALASTQRRFSAYWSAFDAGTLYAGDLNGPGLPLITKAQAADTPLDAVFGPPGDNTAVERLIEEAAVWARANTAIRLPLKHDRNFAVRLTKKGEERIVPRASEREYLRLSRRLFEDGDGDLSWPGFVAAAVLMISRHDPDWRDDLGPEGEDGA
ncbi:MAG: hypothetical protein ACFE0P_09960 [Oceanicaulis sp.]